MSSIGLKSAGWAENAGEGTLRRTFEWRGGHTGSLAERGPKEKYLCWKNDLAQVGYFPYITPNITQSYSKQR